jgi:hypothetical protein
MAASINGLLVRLCCQALLSVTYNDMLASCDGVNVFGRRCRLERTLSP